MVGKCLVTAAESTRHCGWSKCAWCYNNLVLLWSQYLQILHACLAYHIPARLVRRAIWCDVPETVHRDTIRELPNNECRIPTRKQIHQIWIACSTADVRTTYPVVPSWSRGFVTHPNDSAHALQFLGFLSDAHAHWFAYCNFTFGTVEAADACQATRKQMIISLCKYSSSSSTRGIQLRPLCCTTPLGYDMTRPIFCCCDIYHRLICTQCDVLAVYQGQLPWSL